MIKVNDFEVARKIIKETNQDVHISIITENMHGPWYPKNILFLSKIDNVVECRNYKHKIIFIYYK